MNNENTVLLSLKKYDNLMTISKGVLDDKCIVSGFRNSYYIKEKGEIITELELEIKDAYLENNRLREKLGKPKNTYYYHHQDELKDWSLFRFLKNRRKYKYNFKERIKEVALDMAK